jgi:hypothetical protein
VHKLGPPAESAGMRAQAILAKNAQSDACPNHRRGAQRTDPLPNRFTSAASRAREPSRERVGGASRRPQSAAQPDARERAGGRVPLPRAIVSPRGFRPTRNRFRMAPVARSTRRTRPSLYIATAPHPYTTRTRPAHSARARAKTRDRGTTEALTGGRLTALTATASRAVR